MDKHNRVNPELFQKIKNRLDVEQAQVYREINKVADKYNLEREFAAIKLAASVGLSITKYKSEEYYTAIRSNTSTSGEPPAKEISQPIVRSRARRIKTPPKAELSFSNIRNPDLLEILERDVQELNQAISIGYDKMRKICMILSGSIIEALLLERLTRNTQNRNQAIITANQITKNKPRNPNQPETWGLATLVEITQNLPSPLLPADSLPQIGALRGWRNLIHPGRELRERIQNRIFPTKQRAKNAVTFLEFIANELL